MRCLECMFWCPPDDGAAIEDGDFGQCRSKSPLPVLYEMESDYPFNRVSWPLTRGREFCGDFKSKRKRTPLPKEVIAQTLADRSILRGKGWVPIDDITKT